MTAFNRPTLSALREQARGAIAARLPGADPALARSVLGVLADVYAGLLHHQYAYLDWMVGQLIPVTAEAEYLERWCRLVGITRRPAAASTGTVQFLGTDGAAIPAGTRLVRSDGAAYLTQAETAIAAGAALAAVEAEEAGEAGDLAAGGSLALATAIPGVLGTATVQAPGLAGGAPAEADAELRERLRARLSSPPQGGAAADYVAWAMEVPGVTRAWCTPLARGAGTVNLTFIKGGRADVIPSPAEVAEVQAHIDPLRPVTADVLVFAPTPAPLAITIGGLNPDTAAVRGRVEEELRAQILRDAEPGGTIRRSRLIEAVGRAAGENWHTMTAPAADVTHASGVIATFGAVTFA
jgi:uncharacterized phage protein gp47/JayE